MTAEEKEAQAKVIQIMENLLAANIQRQMELEAELETVKNSIRHLQFVFALVEGDDDE